MSTREFASTHWSLIVAAGQRASPESDRALAELCERYWLPLYAYVRRRVPHEEDARDLTQEFFARLLGKNVLAAADPDRGRFRAFLLTSCKHFLAHEWEKARAQKRGGGRRTLPLDFQSGDSRLSFEPADPWTPERHYHRQWAVTLLEQVLAKLRAEHAGAVPFDRLKPFLTGSAEMSYATAAAEWGMTEGALKVAVHRLRKRYRELLRQEVADTLAEGEDVEGEIRELFEALG